MPLLRSNRLYAFAFAMALFWAFSEASAAQHSGDRQLLDAAKDHQYGSLRHLRGLGFGVLPGFGPCRYGQATAVAPYAVASANRCGATSASTYPVINPLTYPGIGRKLKQNTGGISIVNSNPVSVSNTNQVIQPAAGVKHGALIGFNLFG